MTHRHQNQRSRALLRGSLRGFHCTREQLEALEDGELGRARERRVLRHLESCAACRDEHASASIALGDARAALEQHPRIAAPPDFDAQVWAAIESRRQHPPSFGERLGAFWLLPAPRLLSSAAAGLLAALLFGHMVSWQVAHMPGQEPAVLAPVMMAPPSQ